MATGFALACLAPTTATAATLSIAEVPGGHEVRYIADAGELNQVYIELDGGKVLIQEGSNYGVVTVHTLSPCEARPPSPASTPMYSCPAADVVAIRVDLGDQNDTLGVGSMSSLRIPVAVDAGVGNDDIWSRDEFQDQIDCGAGDDRLRADATDLTTGCEHVDRSGGDSARPRADGKPIGVSINNGAAFTNDPRVTLTAYGPDAATMILMDNDGGFGHALEFPVSLTAHYDWRLVDSGSERLPKMVYVRFAGDGVDETRVFTDDIILDTSAPVVSTARAHAGKLRVSARDTTSGIGSMQLRYSANGAATKFRSFARTTRLRQRTPRFVRVRDRAKNLSRWHAVNR
jgi:hypothetical protein